MKELRIYKRAHWGFDKNRRFEGEQWSVHTKTELDKIGETKCRNGICMVDWGNAPFFNSEKEADDYIQSQLLLK